MSNARASFELPPWDRAALDYMRGKANVEGTMGVMLIDGPEAVAWQDYFMANNLPLKANNLAYRVSTNATYMVPTRWPWEYDASWPKRPPAYQSVVRSTAHRTNVEGTEGRAGSRGSSHDEPF